MSAAIALEQSRLDAATDSVLAPAGDPFVANSLCLSIALLVAAISAAVFIRKNPRPRSLVVWLTLGAAAAALAVHRFVETPGQDADPYQLALQQLKAVLREHPQETHTPAINERALDLATVTMMHWVGSADYTLTDAEANRRAIDVVEAGRRAPPSP